MEKKNIPVAPVDLNCGTVMSLAFKGHLAAVSSSDDTLLFEFIRAYRGAISLTVEFIVSLTKSNFDDRIAVYLLLNPTHVPADIAASPLWTEVVTSPDGGVAGASWEKIQAASNIYLMMRGYVDPTARATQGGKAFAAVLAHYGIKPTSLTMENTEKHFGFFAGANVSLSFRAAVAGAAKSFLSNRELAFQLNLERRQTIDRLLEQYPEFFGPFMRVHKTESAFASAARHFADLRRALKSEGYLGKVIAACQWRTVIGQEHLAAWQPAENLDENFLATAEQYPEVVARFVALTPIASPPPLLPSDRFHRIASAKSSPRDIAKNIYVVTRVLSIYQAAFKTLSSEKYAEIAPFNAERPNSKEHQGWLKIIAATKKTDPALFAIRSFVLGPVREFCNAMWPVTIPDSPKLSGLSPLVPNNIRYGWSESNSALVDIPSNALPISVLIPGYRQVNGVMTTEVRVEALVRGNIPGIRARKLASPLNVKNGLTQFLPDRSLPMPGTSGTRSIFLKLQALRLYETNGRLFGIFSACLMPELPESSIAPTRERAEMRKNAKARSQVIERGRYREISIGEKVATIHVAPGGLRVATVAIFQRVAPSADSPTGFEQIEFTRLVQRSDSSAYVGLGEERRLKFNQGLKKERIVNFEADELDREFEKLDKLPSVGATGFIPPLVNQKHMATFGAFRTNAGKLFYRKIAREIADLCARNQVGHVVVGGAGIIFGKSRTQHPFRDFYTLMKVGGKQQVFGYLPTSLSKVGARIYAVSAKGARFDMQSTRRGLDAPLNPVTAFHISRVDDTEEQSTVAVTKGKKTRIIRNDWVSHGEDWIRASKCYPTNAAWAILIHWFDAEFKEKVDAALESLDDAKPSLLPLTKIRENEAKVGVMARIVQF